MPRMTKPDHAIIITNTTGCSVIKTRTHVPLGAFLIRPKITGLNESRPRTTRNILKPASETLPANGVLGTRNQRHGDSHGTADTCAASEAVASATLRSDRPVKRKSIALRSRLTVPITDRRRKRALAANPVSDYPGASSSQRVAAVRVHRFVKLQGVTSLMILRSAPPHSFSCHILPGNGEGVLRKRHASCALAASNFNPSISRTQTRHTRHDFSSGQ